MMNCGDAGDFIDAWENGTQPQGKIADFRTHIAGCPDCSGRYGALLSLIERDDASPDEASYGALPEGFSAGILGSLDAKVRIRRHVFPRLAFVAAAAAAIFIAGLGIGMYGGFRGGGFGHSDTVTVRFVLEASDAREAKRVHLTGDFNSWSTEGYELRHRESDSVWELRIPLKKGRVYVYNFILDGEDWITDPTVPARINDGFGGSGSLLRL